MNSPDYSAETHPGARISLADSGRHPEDQMARRRHQRGQLSLRGKEKLWVGRWREDLVRPDGTIHRARKSEVIGSLKEFKTRRLAARELEQRLSLSEVNSLTYKPRPTATFAQFAEKWLRDVLSQKKPSTGSADRSRIRKHLLPELGKIVMKDIDTQLVQTLIAKKKAEGLSAKSVRNLVLLLRIMWRSAKAWRCLPAAVMLDFDGLELTQADAKEPPSLTLDEMQRIVEAAPEPLRTFFWLLGETGMRAGEIAGLPVANLLLDLGAVKVSQAVWHGKIGTVKSRKAKRTIEISPELVLHLRHFLRTWRPNRAQLLFASQRGTPWDVDVVRKRKLYPLLEKLGIERCGFHAFRHGNETVMDLEHVPAAVRMDRMGHTDPRMMMNYTHVASEDGRLFASRLGRLLEPQENLRLPLPLPAGNA
jgi:integrase